MRSLSCGISSERLLTALDILAHSRYPSLPSNSNLQLAMALPCAVLTEEQVLTIKRRIYKGEKLETIARSYDVSFRSISNIKRGVNWPDVKWPTGTGDHQGALEGAQLARVPGARERSEKAQSQSTRSRRSSILIV
jgi:hypothetical protein